MTIKLDPSKMIFRKINCADYIPLSIFFEENNLSEVIRLFHPFPLNSDSARKIACSPHKDCYYAVWLEGNIIAFSMLRGWDEGYIVPSLGMLVDHRFHNCGIGGWLLDRTIEEAAKLGCSRIRLSVYENNKPALRLYLSRGFVEISREKVSIMGRECIKIMMNKTLPG